MLTDEQILKVAELIAQHNGGDAADYLDEITETRDPLASFAKIAASREDTPGGTVLRDCQTHKGAERKNIYIVDFGDVRGLYVI